MQIYTHTESSVQGHQSGLDGYDITWISEYVWVKGSMNSSDTCSLLKNTGNTSTNFLTTEKDKANNILV